MLDDIIKSAQYGAEIGGVIGGLFDTAHADEYNKAFEITESIDYDNPNESEVKEALALFSKVNAEDKLYIRCWAWYRMAFCHALLTEFSKSYSCLASIESVETDFFTLHKDDIRETKKQVPEARKVIRQVEQEWKEEQERKRREEEERRRREEEKRRELASKNGSSNSSTTKSNSGLPGWAIAVMAILLVAVTVLVCNILFR